MKIPIIPTVPYIRPKKDAGLSLLTGVVPSWQQKQAEEIRRGVREASAVQKARNKVRKRRKKSKSR